MSIKIKIALRQQCYKGGENMGYCTKYGYMLDGILYSSDREALEAKESK